MTEDNTIERIIEINQEITNIFGNLKIKFDETMKKSMVRIYVKK